MKRELSLRNRLVSSAALIALLLTASSFTFNPSVDAPLAGDGHQKKEQKVKVIVKKEGKEMKIDTTFNFPDEKMINFKVDSMLSKLGIEENDSGMTRHMKKIIHMGDEGNVISPDDLNNSDLMPPPPPPPPPPFMNGQFGTDPFAFGTNNASIISYTKKDIGKGLEKITIIRKKQTEY